MKNRSLIFAAIFGALGLIACDEGDIQEQNPEAQTSGKVAQLTAHISGLDSWSSQYGVVLAGFAEGSDYAVVQKRLTEAGDGNVETTMNLTSDDVATIELCVTNRLRQRVVTFASAPISQMLGDTLRLDAGDVNAGMFQSIQDLVFTTTCARCHGLGNSPAANLSLAEGQSYAALVSHDASRPERGVRVVPGDAEASLLHKVIHGDSAAGVSFDHSNMIKESTTITLIDSWINAGAKP
ncbi:MAG: hypothetical protein IJT48_02960 [Bacteroidaceae bacterium]|nr:hypothetical protein [Bacteroidaceae bacterium]